MQAIRNRWEQSLITRLPGIILASPTFSGFLERLRELLVEAFNCEDAELYLVEQIGSSASTRIPSSDSMWAVNSASLGAEWTVDMWKTRDRAAAANANRLHEEHEASITEALANGAVEGIPADRRSVDRRPAPSP